MGDRSGNYPLPLTQVTWRPPTDDSRFEIDPPGASTVSGIEQVIVESFQIFFESFPGITA